MEQHYHEAVASTVKKQAGQSGIDGNIHRRTKRVEIRVSPKEHAELGEKAIAAGYDNLAQYLRETGLCGIISHPSNDELAWLQAINLIGNYVAEIAVQLKDGREPDEEILLVLMQVQDIAEEVRKEVKQARGTGTA
ncbi:hypothetical protein PQR53_15260 [Paraburkholderia fungorum]|uniref:plasmid mobilization protein n=1 Tax=Paraburkholderia fungorum TaxID=134537 RepID=UPI0038B766C8